MFVGFPCINNVGPCLTRYLHADLRLSVFKKEMHDRDEKSGLLANSGTLEGKSARASNNKITIYKLSTSGEPLLTNGQSILIWIKILFLNVLE